MEQLVNLNFNPYPTLFTERLILREITAVDYEDVFLLRSNPIVTKALDKVPFVKLEEAQAFVVFLEKQLKKQQGIRWAVCFKENNKMIGCVGFHWIEQGRSLAEIGYELLPDFHRKGIASEAILAVLHYAFNEIKLIEIEAGVNPDNSISINLLQKFGFKLSRHGKADYYFDGIYLDSDYYILTKKDFLNTI